MSNNSCNNKSKNENNSKTYFSYSNGCRCSSQSVDQDACSSVYASPQTNTKKSNGLGAWRKSTVSLIMPQNTGSLLSESVIASSSGSPHANDLSVRKAKLSSLKKTRNSEKLPMPAPTILPLQCQENGVLTNYKETDYFNLKKHKKSSSNQNEDALKRLDDILERIDILRQLLGKVRYAEYSELVGFEACMLNWEAILKV